MFEDDGADGGLGECPKNVIMADRPRTTYFEDVENLTVRGITFRDAAFWTLHMAGCRHVVVDGIRILNDQRGTNNDGINPDTCQDVVISNYIVKAGDDVLLPAFEQCEKRVKKELESGNILIGTLCRYQNMLLFYVEYIGKNSGAVSASLGKEYGADCRRVVFRSAGVFGGVVIRKRRGKYKTPLAVYVSGLLVR